MSKARTAIGGGHHHHHHGHGHLHHPFHLLEITVISAQDLFPAFRSMRAYASAWVQSDHRLHTRLDTAGGHTDPTWNDKFVFRVDDTFLRSETSAVNIQIRAARCRLSPLSDPLIGTVRVVLSALHPSSTTRFVALQVRRPSSLRPQGILNVGVALLDAYIQSMPLYSNPEATAFALKDLVERKPSFGSGEEEEKGREWRLERCRSVEVGSWAVEKEREALEEKLEKWRIELSPVHDLENRSDGGRKRRRRSSGRLSCFCCSGGRD